MPSQLSNIYCTEAEAPLLHGVFVELNKQNSGQVIIR